MENSETGSLARLSPVSLHPLVMSRSLNRSSRTRQSLANEPATVQSLAISATDIGYYPNQLSESLPDARSFVIMRSIK